MAEMLVQSARCYRVLIREHGRHSSLRNLEELCELAYNAVHDLASSESSSKSQLAATLLGCLFTTVIAPNIPNDVRGALAIYFPRVRSASLRLQSA
jgi:hypothetical protein